MEKSFTLTAENMYDIPNAIPFVETHFEYPTKGVYVDSVYFECEPYVRLGFTPREPSSLTPKTPAYITIYADIENSVFITEHFSNMVFWSVQQIIEFLEFYGYKIVLIWNVYLGAIKKK